MDAAGNPDRVCFCAVQLFPVIENPAPYLREGVSNFHQTKHSNRWRVRREAEQNIQFAGACDAKPNKTFN
jgi:hypothetical protein